MTYLSIPYFLVKVNYLLIGWFEVEKNVYIWKKEDNFTVLFIFLVKAKGHIPV